MFWIGTRHLALAAVFAALPLVSVAKEQGTMDCAFASGNQTYLAPYLREGVEYDYDMGRGLVGHVAPVTRSDILGIRSVSIVVSTFDCWSGLLAHSEWPGEQLGSTASDVALYALFARYKSDFDAIFVEDRYAGDLPRFAASSRHEGENIQQHRAWMTMDNNRMTACLCATLYPEINGEETVFEVQQ